MTATTPLMGLTATARLFVLLAMGAPMLWGRNSIALIALAGIAGIWFIAQVCADLPHLRRWADPVLEAAVVGVLVALAVPSTLAVAAALAVAPFVGGVRRGLPGVALTTSTQLVAVVLVSLLRFQGMDADQGLAVFTWTVAGVGLGFIGSYLRGVVHDRDDGLQTYRDAQRLIRELIDLSAGLSAGLDANATSGQVMSGIRDRLPASTTAVYVPRGEVLVSLAAHQEPGTQLDDVENVAVEAWARTETVISDQMFAFPFGDTAVVAGTISPDVALAESDLAEMIAAAVADLTPVAVELDTALLFMEFRDAATSDIRKRLAREMHDGVAQDIASLGYLVDALAAHPVDEQQDKLLRMLRERITAVVAEVRQSVLTLRTSIGEAESLGTAISTVARHLSESSLVPITVSLDEHATRLRSEVEAELFRITQEAMNNAIKHSHCSSIAVHCEVKAPSARITITDDGIGLQRGRSDSHGLKIMRERARLVGGQLTVTDHDGGGVLVAVDVDGRG